MGWAGQRVQGRVCGGAGWWRGGFAQGDGSPQAAQCAAQQQIARGLGFANKNRPQPAHRRKQGHHVVAGRCTDALHQLQVKQPSQAGRNQGEVEQGADIVQCGVKGKSRFAQQHINQHEQGRHGEPAGVGVQGMDFLLGVSGRAHVAQRGQQGSQHGKAQAQQRMGAGVLLQEGNHQNGHAARTQRAAQEHRRAKGLLEKEAQHQRCAQGLQGKHQSYQGGRYPGGGVVHQQVAHAEVQQTKAKQKEPVPSPGLARRFQRPGQQQEDHRRGRQTVQQRQLQSHGMALDFDGNKVQAPRQQAKDVHKGVHCGEVFLIFVGSACVCATQSVIGPYLKARP